MAGADDRHMTVTGNVYMALRLYLRGSPCHTLAMDVRLNAATSNAYFYPDVMVTCHPDDHASRLARSHPVLIVEVASPSTAAHDLGAKFAHYRLIEALREYVVVGVDRLSADVYRRSEQGTGPSTPPRATSPSRWSAWAWSCRWRSCSPICRSPRNRPMRRQAAHQAHRPIGP